MTYYERNLPHWQPPGKDLFVTWRLYGSLPREIFATKSQSHWPAGKRFAAIDRCLDTCDCGPVWLNDDRLAALTVEAILQVNRLPFCKVHAFAVMPNHVHLLLQPGSQLSKITKRIKGGTAHAANKVLGRMGKVFWQDESFDRWIRTPAEFDRVRTYIERNPVKARLVRRPEDWKWSSASRLP